MVCGEDTDIQLTSLLPTTSSRMMLQEKTSKSGFLQDMARRIAFIMEARDGKMRSGEPLAAVKRSCTPWVNRTVLRQGPQ